jgi:hypothetical protein
MPEIDEVSVTLMDGGTAKQSCSPDRWLSSLTNAVRGRFRQCLDAAVTGETIIVDVAANNSDYPHFGSACPAVRNHPHRLSGAAETAARRRCT